MNAANLFHRTKTTRRETHEFHVGFAGLAETGGTNQRKWSQHRRRTYAPSGAISELEFAMQLVVMHHMKPTPSSAQEGFCFTQRNTDELHWKRLKENGKATFWRASETEWKGVLGLQAVTVTLPEEATIGQREEQRVISSRLVLRWKEDDRWCAHGFKDPDNHEIERSCPNP